MLLKMVYIRPSTPRIQLLFFPSSLTSTFTSSLTRSGNDYFLSFFISFFTFQSLL
jgi:hypothetical protein